MSQSFETIRAAFKSRFEAPEAAIRAAVAYPDELARAVATAVDGMRRGVKLVPADEALVVFGLHILAALKRRDAYPHVIALVRLPAEEQIDLFLTMADVVLGRLLVSTWDGDVDALLRLIEHADVSPSARWALFNALTRLTFDQRIPRERTLAFLERYAAAPMAEPDDLAWWGWEEAVNRLGFTELQPALDRVAAYPALQLLDETHRSDARALLQRAAAAPTDAGACDLAELAPIDDAVDALSWVGVHATLVEPADADDDDDPGRADGPSDEELAWLAAFLDSRAVPDGTMSIEMLDGFLTALVVGPNSIQMSSYLPVVFDQDGGLDGVFADQAQAQYVLQLVAKLSNSIAARRMADADHRPIIQPDEPDVEGLEWAEGFLTGVGMDANGWDAIYDHPRAGEALHRIHDLGPGDPEGDEPPVPDAARALVLEDLPSLVRQIAAFWRNPRGKVPPLQEPVRSTKVGRNDPCPCGSGKKFKKCHGALDPESNTRH